MDEILLSIVIPCYNSERYVGECLESLRIQATECVEVIVVDGGSSDGTLGVVSAYRDVVDHVISEPDQGQSDAINKGFMRAKGQFMTWLNSDDVLLLGVLPPLVEYLEATDQDCVFGNVLWFGASGEITRVAYGPRRNERLVHSHLLLPFGPSAFVRRRILEDLGGLDLSYHYIMDIEYWWRIVRSGYKIGRVPFVVWGLRFHEESKTSPVILHGEAPEKMVEERARLAALYDLPGMSRQRRAIQFFERLMDGTLFKTAYETFKYRRKAVSEYAK